MDSPIFALTVLAVFSFGLLSGRLERSIITAPIVFCAFGLVVGKQALGMLSHEESTELIHLIAEITLILVLFTDASRIDLRPLKKEHDLPVRLLLIGLPLTILLGAGAAMVIFTELSLFEALVLGAVLAPTDAALGQAVVSSPLVPVRIRQALNVESGLNDGIALPGVLLFMSLAEMQAHHDVSKWIRFAGFQVVLGPLVGAAVALIGSRLIKAAKDRALIGAAFLSLSMLMLSLLSFSLAELVGGNGFIAAFIGGLVLGNTSANACESMHEFAEAEGQLLSLVTFMLFGAALLPETLTRVNGHTVLYALLSLTFIRMVPVALSVLGKSLKPQTQIFMGWFGPRGLATILFALLVLEAMKTPGKEVIIDTAMLTVALSILLHGITAYPGARWFAQMVKKVPDCPELQEVTQMPVRARHRAVEPESVKPELAK